MDSLCGGAIDCLDCLKDLRYFVKFRNLTTCCIYNLGNFDVSYFSALQPGDEAMCPVAESHVLTGVLGTVAGLGALAGLGCAVACWFRSRRLSRQLCMARERPRQRQEEQRLLPNASNNYYDVPLDVGSSRGVRGSAVGERGREGNMSAILPARNEQRQQVALLSARSRGSRAVTPTDFTETDPQERREINAQMNELRKWGESAVGGAIYSKTRTKEVGGEKTTEKYEMTVL